MRSVSSWMCTLHRMQMLVKLNAVMIVLLAQPYSVNIYLLYWVMCSFAEVIYSWFVFIAWIQTSSTGVHSWRRIHYSKKVFQQFTCCMWHLGNMYPLSAIRAGLLSLSVMAAIWLSIATLWWSRQTIGLELWVFWCMAVDLRLLLGTLGLRWRSLLLC